VKEGSWRRRFPTQVALGHVGGARPVPMTRPVAPPPAVGWNPQARSTSRVVRFEGRINSRIRARKKKKKARITQPTG
jgi:hypothetical protein